MKKHKSEVEGIPHPRYHQIQSQNSKESTKTKSNRSQKIKEEKLAGSNANRTTETDHLKS